MKILIISPSLDPTKNVSGISSVVGNIIHNSRLQYIHFEFGSTDSNIKASVLKKALLLFNRFIKYWKVIKDEKPDIVHMNVPCNTPGVLREWVILKINKYHKQKVVVHLHGGVYLMTPPSNRLLNSWLKYILKKADAVLVLSQLESDTVSRLYGCNCAQVLSNSVEISYNSKLFKQDKELLSILFLGRITDSKGIEDIVEALRLLSKERRFRFTLCGSGDLKERVIEACTEFMGDHFCYEGVVSGEKKSRIISESDIFLLPSRYGEGLPMAMLETMATGVVPVVTDDASIKLVVKDGENGLFVEKNNPTDIFNKLKFLIENPAKMEMLSQNARKTIEESYSMDHYINSLETIYNKL